jgi:two-component system, chemotaxis family, sensor kinase CheA
MSEISGGAEDMRDILQEFVVDSKEMLEAIEPILVELETQYDNEKINNIFRCFHSIKGGAGFLNLNDIQKVTHAAETLLDLFRKGKLVFASDHLDVMVAVCDQMVRMLDRVYDGLNDQGFEAEVDRLCAVIDDSIAGRSAIMKPVLTLSPESPTTEEPAGVIEEMEIPITEEMIVQFVQEAESGFEKIEEVLLILEKCGFEKLLLDNAYRLIHSFKGNCGFMNFKDLELISHKVETVFDGMKNQQIPTTEENVTALFQALDVIRGTVAQLSRSGQSAVQGLDDLLGVMDGIIGKAGSDPEPSVIATVRPASCPIPSTGDVDKNLREVDEKTGSSKLLQADIRVNLAKVDKVINLVGELMIVSQMITRHLQSDAGNTGRSSHQLNNLITELQDVAMSIRMIPLAGTFRKMVRLVRDLSKKSGKQVVFDARGEDTELDKTVVEQISDPLVHLVRNAIDHGIELPGERIAAGKPPSGRLLIEAKYEGNEVWISIIDDGRGLDRDRILAKGIERNLVTEEEAKDWSDNRVFKLVFEPGFSTAEQITSVSGRGVGMDVVKRNIEKVKGHVDIKSLHGQGTTIGLRIPLTLAIIDGMLLRVGSAVYTAPLLAIRESLQVRPSQVTMVDNREVVMIRGNLYPVYRLHRLHHIEPEHSRLEDGILIILEHQDEVFGLFVDELLGQYQTVIKALSAYFGKIPGVSGCSILSNGEVSLILDVADLRKEIA